MDSQTQQASERIKQASNILVTVSTDPSVDQLAACIGLTLSLNKMGKHATAVFSGATPSTIEFLQPEKTIEKNTDSLRDFIIALDKSKADKLRYKVEDRVVKIFITPYRTSISDKDLEFSQGDFNVDVVVALGVHNQADLDQAITSHGRILHDATVVTLNTRPGGELGSINWLDPNASSLSELAVQLIDSLDKKLVDGQIATAFLTGIVAETERFSNAKTSPRTMSISAELMAEGANQQLVATKLEEPAAPPIVPIAPAQPASTNPTDATAEAPAKKSEDGTLEISHDADDKKAASDTESTSTADSDQSPTLQETPEVLTSPDSAPEPAAEPQSTEESKADEPANVPVIEPEAEKRPIIAPQIHIDEHGAISPLDFNANDDILPPLGPKLPPTISHHGEKPNMVPASLPTSNQLPIVAPGAFAETNDGLAPPQPEDTSPPALVEPSAPAVGQTITPPADMGDESPSGGSAPSDSFIVGQQPVPPSVETIPTDVPIVPAATETLSEIEKQLGSPHTSVVPGQAAASLPAPSDASLPMFNNAANAAVDSAMPTNAFSTPASNPAVPELNTNDAPDTQAPDVNGARDAVAEAFNSVANPPLDPIDALNAQPVNLNFGNNAPNNQPAVAPAVAPAPEYPSVAPVQPWTPSQSPTPPIDPTGLTLPGIPATPPYDPNAPPPGPPPMMPPTNQF